MNRRRGISLIELVVVMSACVVLLSLSAAFLQRVMLAQAPLMLQEMILCHSVNYDRDHTLTQLDEY